MATHIDYTPGYAAFGQLSRDFSWYNSDNPISKHWYWRSFAYLRDLAKEISEKVWNPSRVPKVGVTTKYVSRQGLNYQVIDNSPTGAPEDKYVCGVTAVSLPVEQPSYLFLPNTDASPSYVMVEISDSAKVFTGITSIQALSFSPLMPLIREMSRDNIATINNNDNDGWWNSLHGLFPSADWIPTTPNVYMTALNGATAYVKNQSDEGIAYCETFWDWQESSDANPDGFYD
ncbi:hypothetical protein SAMD00019534_119100 [Acytostelium subglobosum LB1]|uniref:hypothetical protein n=1 Tax=Acytostelium subglobosum LB1 TaxID=1410327 RepID=UPI0006447B68|nr:hypothetical protein SAMD00019534_119100 [Acytostelium subglobosum LB1]GAM28734.1 hypothetical protein SAMD00019534_119100 [Acytostelium subglobosum LB1]|eukprot:XP_012748289.1 hypothetical protein SAMD00019534_119100 [Acytostelium subglobosum LB1]